MGKVDDPVFTLPDGKLNIVKRGDPKFKPIVEDGLRQKEKKKEEGAQFVKYFGPLLDALRGLGGSGTPDEVVERIAGDLRIPDEIQNELLPSGEPRYRNQVHWARFYLVREGLLDSSKRGIWSSH